MTTTTATQPSRARWRCLLLAALAAVLAFVLPAGTASASGLPAAGTRVGAVTPAVSHVVGVHECITAGQRPVRGPSQLRLVSGHCVAAEGGTEVLLDTSAVKAQAAARGLMKPGECAVICSTVQREAAEQGFSAAGLPVVADGTSAVLRGQVATQLRGFGAAARGLENDATIGATALERGIPLITGARALWNAVLKLGGDARWFAPGG